MGIIDELKRTFIKQFGNEHRDLQAKINKVKHPKDLLPYVKELLQIYLRKREELLVIVSEQDENIERIKSRIQKSKGAMGKLLKPTLKTEVERFATFAQRYVKNEARIRELYKIEEAILSVTEEIAIPADLIDELNFHLDEINAEYEERVKALEETQELFVKSLDKEDLSILDEFKNSVYEKMVEEEVSEKEVERRLSRKEKLKDLE